MEPEAALELKPVGRGLNEKFLQPCYSEVPKDESVPRPVCQHVPYERNPGLIESVSKAPRDSKQMFPKSLSSGVGIQATDTFSYKLK